MAFFPPFCAHKECHYHYNPPTSKWFDHFGYYHTNTHGKVPRYRCKSCNKTFSKQTFSVHFYAKKLLDLKFLEEGVAESLSIRALSRLFFCSPNSVLNRLDRLSRQAIAIHSVLRPKAFPREPVCFDGLVSFDRSQYYPSDIGISITKRSRFVLGLSHATTRRSGRMTPYQRKKRELLDQNNIFEKKAVIRSFKEHLDMILDERPHSAKDPFILITDEKLEYVRALQSHSIYLDQNNGRRMIHLKVSSKSPRNFENPLFASNYYDREVRKDQAHHRRETVCFAKNAATGMARLYIHMVHHNYKKKYLINQQHECWATAATVAGIPKMDIETQLNKYFKWRAFLSHQSLKFIDFKIWAKEAWDPAFGGIKRGYNPKFAFA